MSRRCCNSYQWVERVIHHATSELDQGVAALYNHPIESPISDAIRVAVSTDPGRGFCGGELSEVNP